MGMFDTVHFTCPKCGGKIERQSKAGECRLNDYQDYAVPLSIAGALIDSLIGCPKCKNDFLIKTNDNLDIKLYLAPFMPE